MRGPLRFNEKSSQITSSAGVEQDMEPLFDRYKEIIPDFESFQKRLYRPLSTHLRVNVLKMDPASLLKSFAEKNIHLPRASEKYDRLFHAPDLKSPGNLMEYALGYIHAQALTSCLAAFALDVQPHSYVLDMCASPGGKTSQMSGLMNNTGLIIANELYPSRHIPLAHNLARLGVLNCVITGYQAQEFPMRDQFDYILADVPCSGEGRVRITREGFRSRDKKYIKDFSHLQKRIILRGYDLLKKGGVMLYATCTYNPEENESVVDYLLKNRDAHLFSVETGFAQEPGIRDWNNEQYDGQIKKTARFYPHRVDSVGFFMAKIGRRG